MLECFEWKRGNLLTVKPVKKSNICIILVTVQEMTEAACYEDTSDNLASPETDSSLLGSSITRRSCHLIFFFSVLGVTARERRPHFATCSLPFPVVFISTLMNNSCKWKRLTNVQGSVAYCCLKPFADLSKHSHIGHPPEAMLIKCMGTWDCQANFPLRDQSYRCQEY